jgi:S-adenosylmethionine hydrolase
MNVITLTTDFGTQDWFVGTMKGVILGIAPQAVLIDLTHQVRSGEISDAAFVLAMSYREFPRGTVHLVVVDPGVGGPRAALAIQTEQYFFVGPDNGVLSLAVAQERLKVICRLENSKLFRPHISRTFHGRDVFAPTAGYLSRGMPLRRLGPEVHDFQELPWPAPQKGKAGWTGEVIYLDHFGNAITNLSATLPVFAQARSVLVLLRGRRKAVPLVEFYQSVREGEALAVLGSTGFLEIAINGGSAAEKMGLKRGDRVFLGSRR